jgi:hypothetical protein
MSSPELPGFAYLACASVAHREVSYRALGRLSPSNGDFIGVRTVVKVAQELADVRGVSLLPVIYREAGQVLADQEVTAPTMTGAELEQFPREGEQDLRVRLREGDLAVRAGDARCQAPTLRPRAV